MQSKDDGERNRNQVTCKVKNHMWGTAKPEIDRRGSGPIHRSSIWGGGKSLTRLVLTLVIICDGKKLNLSVYEK